MLRLFFSTICCWHLRRTCYASSSFLDAVFSPLCLTVTNNHCHVFRLSLKEKKAPALKKENVESTVTHAPPLENLWSSGAVVLSEFILQTRWDIIFSLFSTCQLHLVTFIIQCNQIIYYSIELSSLIFSPLWFQITFGCIIIEGTNKLGQKSLGVDLNVPGWSRIFAVLHCTGESVP